jgi:hypothetical protein
MEYSKYTCPICDQYYDGDNCWETQTDLNEYIYQLMDLFKIAYSALSNISELPAGSVENTDIADAAIAVLKTRMIDFPNANDLLESAEK